MKKLFIILISVIFICSCNSNSSTQLVNHEGQYDCFYNIFDTVRYLSLRDSMEHGYTYSWPTNEYMLNLNYKDSTLWLYYSAIDVHKYDKVAYKDYNGFDKINDLSCQKFTFRVYYYINTEKIILITGINRKNLNNFDLLETDNAWYNKINENLKDFENKISEYIDD